MSIVTIIFCIAAATFTAGEISNPKVEDVPYLVSIRAEEGQHICLGAVLKTNLVIAPLNCVQSEKVSVYAGSIDPESSSDEGVQIVKVKEIDRRIFGRGIRAAAFLTLEKDLSLTNNVKTIKFLKETPKEGDVVTIHGFGIDLDKNEPIKKLTSTKSKVAKYEDCYSAQQVPTYNNLIFCIDPPANNIEFCKVLGPATLLTCNEGADVVLCGLAYGDGQCIDAVKPSLSFLKTSAIEQEPSKYDI